MKAPTRPPRGEENAIRMASSPSGNWWGLRLDYAESQQNLELGVANSMQSNKEKAI